VSINILWRRIMARVVDYLAHQNVVGDNVKKYRLERHMSQKELSEKLEMYAVYVCRGSISRIERHERTVTDYELKALSESLKVSINQLFESNENGKSSTNR
jgi:transcriptional regulator with XRE-family HTH domain